MSEYKVVDRQRDLLNLTDLERLREMAENFDVHERKAVLSCIPMNEILDYVAAVFEDFEAKQQKLIELSKILAGGKLNNETAI